MSSGRFAVLAVCTANICRSPMIEIMLREQLDPDRFEVGSAGVQGFDGHPMDTMSAAELERFDLDGSTFRSRAVQPFLLESADLVLTATRSHRAWLLEDAPRTLARTFTLREFAGLCATVPDDVVDPREVVAAAARARHEFVGEPDVDDPYRRGAETHRSTADLIHDAATTVARRLSR